MYLEIFGVSWTAWLISQSWVMEFINLGLKGSKRKPMITSSFHASFPSLSAISCYLDGSCFSFLGRSTTCEVFWWPPAGGQTYPTSGLQEAFCAGARGIDRFKGTSSTSTLGKQWKFKRNGYEECKVIMQVKMFRGQKGSFGINEVFIWVPNFCLLWWITLCCRQHGHTQNWKAQKASFHQSAKSDVLKWSLNNQMKTPFFFSADILALKVQIFPHEHHLLDQAVPRGWCWFDEAIS